jgi:3',5'-cyclic AMP phosphodiesterase CpdA
MKTRFLVVLVGVVAVAPAAAHENHRADWKPEAYAPSQAHAPTPLPDRVVLTWVDDPATSQAVTWRTDTSIKAGIAEIAVANNNGRALAPRRVQASTQRFESDLSTAHYHTVRFEGLEPETLYTYRVGDGVNWTEYFHFQTASREPKPFTFIYFGDAQNEVQTHWSRVFREAFREAPRAAFTLHAGDLINEDWSDKEWGEWFWAPAWVNATVPVIATPGNHEYFRAEQGPANERFWRNSSGEQVPLDVEIKEVAPEPDQRFRATARDEQGREAVIEFLDDGDEIVEVTGDIEAMLGYAPSELIGTEFDDPPLDDVRRDRGVPRVSTHWRPSFEFPVQEVPAAGLEETVYYIDYQGARIISLDSSKEREAQVSWLRGVLEDNPNNWTIVTFHHPMFSPGSDRDNPELRELWKPLFDEFKVDLVLNGHDHTYVRTGPMQHPETVNLPTGYQQAYDPEIGTVYVVSVSGPKMYEITKPPFGVRQAENTQLYQVIHVTPWEIEYRAFTATAELYDAFTLRKREGMPNELVEMLPPDNRR